jgi:hypothetical protein
MLYDFDIEYELFEEGPIDVIEYYVTAHDTGTGRILRHVMGFRTHDLFLDPVTGEEHIYPRDHSDAKREVDLLLRSVRQKGVINPVWWSELVPAAVYP